MTWRSNGVDSQASSPGGLPRPNKLMHYRPEIDGLRALAVTAVILFHAHLLLPGGFVGVDVFFVISGYLIASLLARDLDRGTFRITTFWERRVRRIFPASVLVVLCTLLVGGALCMPGQYVQLARSAMAHALMSANLFFWRTVSYFAGRGETTPLLHMWSLAVEEQFYLVFPVVLAWLWPRGRKVVLIVMALAAIVSLGVSILGLFVARSSSFYLLPARAWEMLLGGMLAVRLPTRGEVNASAGTRTVIGWAGLVAMLIACLWYSAATPYPGWQALLPCVGTVMILWSQEQGLLGVGRLLVWPPLRLIGQMSFSLYLWHWPIMAYLRDFGGHDDRNGMVAAILVTVGLSILSWCFVEEPVRRGFRGVTTSRILALGAGASLSIIAMASLIVVTGGLPSRLPESTRLYGLTGMAPASQAPQAPGRFTSDQDLPTVGASDAVPGRPCLVLWGDSHAAFVSPVLHRIGVERGVSIPVAVMHGTVPIPQMWSSGQDRRVGDAVEQVCRAIERLRPTDVFWVARWSSQLLGIVDQTHVPANDRESVELARQGIARTIERLHAAGVERIWIGLEVPFQSLSPAQIALRQWYLGADPFSFGVSREMHVEQQRRVISVFSVFEGMPGVEFVDLAQPCFSKDGVARPEADDGPVYLDDDHLNDRGAQRFLRPLMERTFFTTEENPSGP
jgi:peptidoglycan/LPS O-acetylase OafA/YrhL